MRAGSPQGRRVEDGVARPRKAAAQFNRIEAGRELLGEIERWSGGDRTFESQLGNVLFVHPGYVPLLRKRLTVTVEKEALVKAFLAAFPDPRVAFKSQRPAISEWLLARGIFNSPYARRDA